MKLNIVALLILVVLALVCYPLAKELYRIMRSGQSFGRVRPMNRRRA